MNISTFQSEYEILFFPYLSFLIHHKVNLHKMLTNIFTLQRNTSSEPNNEIQSLVKLTQQLVYEYDRTLCLPKFSRSLIRMVYKHILYVLYTVMHFRKKNKCIFHNSEPYDD